jgi:hypothetical protein
MPPAFRNNLYPTGCDTPASSAAASLLSPAAFAAERGQFFDDGAQGEASWAHQDQVTRLKPGALSDANPKYIARPVSQFAQGSFELMQPSGRTGTFPG